MAKCLLTGPASFWLKNGENAPWLRINSYVQTSGKVPKSARNKSPRLLLQLAYGGKPAAEMIISRRAFGWLACKAVCGH